MIHVKKTKQLTNIFSFACLKLSAQRSRLRMDSTGWYEVNFEDTSDRLECSSSSSLICFFLLCYKDCFCSSICNIVLTALTGLRQCNSSDATDRTSVKNVCLICKNFCIQTACKNGHKEVQLWYLIQLLLYKTEYPIDIYNCSIHCTKISTHHAL